MAGLPKDTLAEGFDTSGEPVKLGDTDSDGYPVGYIDPEGLAHESHYRAECSRAEGRLLDAVSEWRKGLLSEVPDAEGIVSALVSPEHVSRILRECLHAVRFWLWIRKHMRPCEFPYTHVDERGRWER